MFSQNFKCKIFYINLLRLIWLTENILLQNKHYKIGKYFTLKQTECYSQSNTKIISNLKLERSRPKKVPIK